MKTMFFYSCYFIMNGFVTGLIIANQQSFWWVVGFCFFTMLRAKIIDSEFFVEKKLFDTNLRTYIQYLMAFLYVSAFAIGYFVMPLSGITTLLFIACTCCISFVSLKIFNKHYLKLLKQ